MGRASKLAKCLATGREGRVGFETDDYGLGGREGEVTPGPKTANAMGKFSSIPILLDTV